jgi:hypothetical protein
MEEWDTIVDSDNPEFKPTLDMVSACYTVVDVCTLLRTKFLREDSEDIRFRIYEEVLSMVYASWPKVQVF